MSSGKSREAIWQEWQSLLNVPPAELEDWLQTEASRSVGDSETGESTGHQSGRRIVAIKRTNKGDLTESDWNQMATVVGYIKRHCAQGGPQANVVDSAWRYSLMNWGHDPLREDGCAANASKQQGGHQLAETYHTNTKVEWDWGNGTATGYIREVFREKVTRTLGGSEVTRNASDANPAYIIEQADGDRVLKLHSELRKAS